MPLTFFVVSKHKNTFPFIGFNSDFLQLQIEPISRMTSASKYSSIHQAARRIVQEESIFALWKGHVPAQVLSVVYGVVQVRHNI